MVEVDFTLTSAQHIISGKLLTKINCWVNEVKANHLNRSFKDKYFIKVAAFYNYVIAYNIILQNIYTKVHVYKLDNIIRT